MEPANPPTAAPRRLRELDALRGIAALAVALYHYSYFIQHMVPGTRLPSWQLTWGCEGVKLFFAISAFVMVGTCARTHSLTGFAVARARRLLPEYWLAMLLTGVVAWSFGPARLQVGVVDWFANLPLLQIWTGVPMVDGVYWTLNVEILFYAFMAVAWRLRWTQSSDRLVLGWMAVRLVCWLVPVPERVQQLLLIEHAPYFAVGLLIAPVWLHGISWRRQLPQLAMVLCITALTGDGHAALLVVGIVAILLPIAAGGVAWLRHPGLLWLGAISYPLYLLHAVIGYSIIARLQAAGMSSDGAIVVALAATIALAAGVARLCDAWRSRPARSGQGGSGYSAASAVGATSFHASTGLRAASVSSSRRRGAKCGADLSA